MWALQNEVARVFAANPKILHKIEPVIRRTLIVDPNMASAKLLGDLVKSLGAREVVIEQDEKLALEAARDLEPGIVFTERVGPRLDGESFTRRMRRSNLACRRAPIIMVTSEATASSIKGARDCGVHEFLRKPFTAGDVFKRIEVVALKPRDWIEAVGYVGPDRRRFNSGEYNGPQKRKADKADGPADAAAIKDQAMRILASAFNQFDSDPPQAVRAIREQAIALKALALKGADARLAIAVAGVDSVLAGGAPSRNLLEQPIRSVLALAAPETFAKAS